MHWSEKHPKEGNLEFGLKGLEIVRMKCAGRAFQPEGTPWAKAQRCDSTSSVQVKGNIMIQGVEREDEPGKISWGPHREMS